MKCLQADDGVVVDVAVDAAVNADFEVIDDVDIDIIVKMDMDVNIGVEVLVPNIEVRQGRTVRREFAWVSGAVDPGSHSSGSDDSNCDNCAEVISESS